MRLFAHTGFAAVGYLGLAKALLGCWPEAPFRPTGAAGSG